MRYGCQTPQIHVVSDYSCTDGHDCGELGSTYGLSPFPYQQGVLNDWFAYDEETGEYIHTTCVWIVPRQNGKNATVELYELYQLVVNGRNILHTAHRVDTNRKAFLRLVSFFENKKKYPELAKICKNIRKANGQECIECEWEEDGEIITSKIEFVARSKNAARGFSVDIIVFDEAQELENEQMEAMIPALSASQHEVQKIYIGTPPYPGCHGDVFPRVRKAAMSGKDKHITLSQWCVKEVGDIKDVDRWYLTNPGLGYLIREDAIRSEIVDLSEAGFARERLGLWLEQNVILDHPILENSWLATGRKQPLNDGIVCFGVKIDTEGNRASVVACCKTTQTSEDNIKYDNYHVELVLVTRSMTELADWLAAAGNNAGKIIIDSKTLSEDLKTRIIERGVSKRVIMKSSTSDLYNACAMFTNSVNNKEITHFKNEGQELLDRSVTECVRRSIGKDGAFGFDDCMDAYAFIVESAALAYYVSRLNKRNPKKKQKIKIY